MANRSALIVPRFENINPIGNVAKPFAVAENTSGIPPGELQTVLGTPVEQNLVTVTGLDVGWRFQDPRMEALSLGSHNALGVAVARAADTLKITLVRRNFDTTDTWTFEFFADDWLQLNAASVGDTLALLDTGMRIAATSPERGIYVTIIVGRTSSNQFLIAHDLFSLPIPDTGWVVDVKVDFEVYAGGLIGRRMAELRSFKPTHRIAIKLRSNSTPDAPTEGQVRYDGLGTIITYPGAVAASDDDPAGSATLWYMATNAEYDFVHTAWTVDNDSWIVTSATVSADITFGVSDIGPWHSPRASGDAFARIRTGSGGFEVFPLGGELARNADRNWDLIQRITLPRGSGTSYNRRVELTNTLDLSLYRLLEFLVTYDSTTHEEYPVLVRPGSIRTHPRASSSTSFPGGSTPSADHLILGAGKAEFAYYRFDNARISVLGEPQPVIPMRFEQVSAAHPSRVRSILFGDVISNTSFALEIRGF